MRSEPPRKSRGDVRSGRLLAMVSLVVAMVSAFLLSLAFGSVRIPMAEVVQALVGGEVSRASWADIVWQFRLPRALTATLAGAALSTSGLLMQTLFRNPLAGPYILGVSAGASLGVAAVVLMLGAGTSSLLAGLGVGGDFALAAAASLGAGAALAVVLAAARRVSVLTLLILGMLFSYAASALVTILMHFAVADRLQAYVVWTFGSFGGVTWRQLTVLAPLLVIGLMVAAAVVKPLDAMLLGEGQAGALGVRVPLVRAAVLTSAALLAGGVTAFCGPVGFLGVAVPHLARALLGTVEHRRLLPTTAVMGALGALVADLVAQLPGSDAVLPLNAVTALLGAPVIAFVVLRKRGLDGAF